MPIYFAQFLPAKDRPGAYCVDFPDLPGCFTDGDSLSQALSNARECLTGYLKACGKEGEDIPAPSSAAEVQRKAEAGCRELEIDIPEGTFYQAVEAGALDEKPIQVSVSMLPSLVNSIDRKAKEEGMTRSGLLAAAAKEYVSRQHA
ncbi:type II toxin-antitoxin system HicB family antitoxin [Desulfovibrio sp. ZJ200]|uniref:type II toxin-antitoxin system HicB family antitoxin n=1 Tax=Desulfovibrio sp. ZJ200 TaxID=2709792 RepID=UPI0013E9FD44|nr:type II toxin-antitoxin system HicB family antitoxin [Desulfovibrio sp. ZJ200]